MQTLKGSFALTILSAMLTGCCPDTPSFPSHLTPQNGWNATAVVGALGQSTDHLWADGGLKFWQYGLTRQGQILSGCDIPGARMCLAVLFQEGIVIGVNWEDRFTFRSLCAWIDNVLHL